jgi:hypothetical protein
MTEVTKTSDLLDALRRLAEVDTVELVDVIDRFEMLADRVYKSDLDRGFLRESGGFLIW